MIKYIIEGEDRTNDLLSSSLSGKVKSQKLRERSRDFLVKSLGYSLEEANRLCKIKKLQ